MKIAVVSLPDGFTVNDRGNGLADVIYDVTEDSFGTWTGVRHVGGEIILFPSRSYRHKDLLKRLGYTVDGE